MKHLFLSAVLILASTKMFSQLASDKPASYPADIEKQKTAARAQPADSTLAISKNTGNLPASPGNKKPMQVLASELPAGTLPPRATGAVAP